MIGGKIIDLAAEREKRRFKGPIRKTKKPAVFTEEQRKQLRRTMDKAVSLGAVHVALCSIYESGVTEPRDLLDSLCNILFDGLSFREAMELYKLEHPNE